MPKNANYKDRAKMDLAAVRSQERAVTNDPGINPAGKGKFYSSYAPRDNSSTTQTFAMPDARHAARLRGRAWDARAKASAASPAKK
jgi:hypothetical protein